MIKGEIDKQDQQEQQVNVLICRVRLCFCILESEAELLKLYNIREVIKDDGEVCAYLKMQQLQTQHCSPRARRGIHLYLKKKKTYCR